MHCSKNVGLVRLTHGILLIISQDDHIFSRISKVLVQVRGHVLDIVDASSELSSLVEVINANQKCLSLASTRGILIIIARRCPTTKTVLSLRWGWWSIVIALGISVCADRWQSRSLATMTPVAIRCRRISTVLLRRWLLRVSAVEYIILEVFTDRVRVAIWRLWGRCTLIATLWGIIWLLRSTYITVSLIRKQPRMATYGYDA